MPDLNLAAYFDRIGYDGAQTASIDTLRALHQLHPQTIAFENLDPFLHRPVPLDIESLERKLVRGNRGGYCFEQSTLFMQVLRRLGFHVSGLSARVLWDQPEGTIRPRSHMLLRIELDGRSWLADVGFGGPTLTAPLLIEPGLEQPTPHEVFRIVDAVDYLRVEAKIADNWRALYRFDLSEQFEIDYVVGNYFLSTHPSSMFRTRLMAARPTPTGRLALLNNRLTIRHRGEQSQQRLLETSGEIADVLETLFGVDLPDRDAFEAAIKRESILTPP